MSKVDDFHLSLSSGLTNQIAPLMGWLMIGDSELKRSNAVDVVLDGAPPIIRAEIHGIDPKRPRERIIESGSDVEIHVFNDEKNPELSGIAKVEAIFDSSITKDGKDDPWEPASEQDGPNGRKDWVVKLKTDKVGPGKQTIWIRAEDNVGNKTGDETTPPLAEFVNIVPKRQVVKPVAPPKKPVPVTNDVTVQVLYLQQPVPAKVTLQSALGAPIGTEVTNDAGKHTFLKVPPGTYTLSAVTTRARQNVYRKGLRTITVPKPPEKAAIVTLDVK
jgi:hypothetical protein